MINVDGIVETDRILAFRPQICRFGTEHVIVVPKVHVRSLLELDPGLGAHLWQIVREVARGH